jgi:hypothetical protein
MRLTVTSIGLRYRVLDQLDCDLDWLLDQLRREMPAAQIREAYAVSNDVGVVLAIVLPHQGQHEVCLTLSNNGVLKTHLVYEPTNDEGEPGEPEVIDLDAVAYRPAESISCGARFGKGYQIV